MINVMEVVGCETGLGWQWLRVKHKANLGSMSQEMGKGDCRLEVGIVSSFRGLETNTG